jgi:peroxiredoxin
MERKALVTLAGNPLTLVGDAANVVRYVEIVPEITSEPNYRKAIVVAKSLI